MKLTTLLILLGFLQVSATAYAQHVSLSKKNISLAKLFKELEKQTDYSFLYKSGTLDGLANINIDIRDASIDEIMQKCIADKPLVYLIVDKSVVIKRKVVIANAAQQAQATLFVGKVFDDHNVALPGVSVSVKGSTAGATVTDTKGEFSILATDPKAVLVFSYVGFDKQEIPTAGLKNPLSIVMKPSTSNLDQVQVIGYGTTTKRLNPGSVTTITAKQIQDHPVGNVLEALMGQVPGLQITQNTGQVGGSFTLRVRGASNLSPVQGRGTQVNAGTTPLILVDGVPIPGGNLPLTGNYVGSSSFLEGGNALNYLNPQDIESVSILKDADATAVYGARAAYGVILITTKKAKAGPPTLSFTGYSGFSVAGTVPKLFNTQQYLAMRNAAVAYDKANYTFFGSVIGASDGTSDADINGTWSKTDQTNWQKILYGSLAQSSNYNLSYSGGSQYTSFLIAGDYDTHGNIQRHKGSSDDGTIRFSLTSRTPDNKFDISLTGSYNASSNNMTPTVELADGLATAPNQPKPFLPDGTLDWSYGSNPAAAENNIYQGSTKNLLSNLTLEYRPIQKITLRTIIAYNDLQTSELYATPSTVYNPNTTNIAKYLTDAYGSSDTHTLTVSPYAEYETALGSKGDLDVKAGGEINEGQIFTNRMTGSNFASDALIYDPANANDPPVIAYNKTPKRDMGFYGIIKYIWDQKYIVDFNGRRDGTTRFGPGNRFGNFGSAAAAWIFSEEKFIKDNLPFLSFGKLRGSAGVTGGDQINDYAYENVWQPTSGGTYDGITGIGPINLANPFLHWEKSIRKDAAIELGFLKNRINLEADYYYNKNTDEIIAQPLSSVTGFQTYSTNTNSVIRATGWEFTLTSTNVKSNSFSWTTNINMTIPHSKLISLDNAGFATGSYNPYFIVGKPVTGITLFKYNGVDPQTGQYFFTDRNGKTGPFNNPFFNFLPGFGPQLNQTNSNPEGVASNSDKTQFIDLAPKFYGGFSNSFSYKQFSLSTLFTYTKKMGLTLLGQQSLPLGILGVNPSVASLNYWKKPGDITNIPAPNASLYSSISQSEFVNSTGAYGDASYIRLQNAVISYSFSPQLISKMHVKALRIYAEGENLLTFSGYHGLDPENLSVSSLPTLRTITFGLNVTL